MAKYQQYAEYKDSGVEWLGKIPSHWTMSKLRYLFDFSKGLSITKENLQDEGIPCVNYGEVHSKYGFEVDPKKHLLKCVSENYLKTSENALLNNGDFVFADTSEDLKGSGNFTHLVGDEQIFAGYHTVIARPHNANASRFYAYLFESKEFRSQIHLAVKGVKVFSITQAMLRSANAWLPSTDEQVKIANFLDHETAKIDSLIEKQQQLIQLLKEKRQAVISHAVTKGLDPNVPMKDSGVEWLGNVPEHWEISRLKHILDMPMRNGLFKKKDQFGSGSLLVNVTDLFVENNFINTDNLESVQTTFDERKAYKVNYGDLFFVRSSLKLEGIGRSACFLSYHDNAVFECHVVNARPNVKKISSKYLTRYLNSIAVIQEYIRRSKTTTMTTIDQNGISSINIVVPPKVEQINIDNYLDNQLEIFSDGEKKAKAIIDLLIERRTALISAAVTGKIDVRNWQNPNKNNKGNMELSA